MRTWMVVFAVPVLALIGCSPRGNPELRSREARPFPDPTMGTNNSESQWYKTQILAAPSAPGASTNDGAAAVSPPAKVAPAKLPSKPVPTHKTPPNTQPGQPTGF